VDAAEDVAATAAFDCEDGTAATGTGANTGLGVADSSMPLCARGLAVRWCWFCGRRCCVNGCFFTVGRWRTVGMPASISSSSRTVVVRANLHRERFSSGLRGRNVQTLTTAIVMHGICVEFHVFVCVCVFFGGEGERV